MVPEFEEVARNHPNAYETGIPMNHARCIFGMDDVHKMTANQKKIYRNHNGSTTSYCAISIFGLCPPELLGVFRNPIDYYRYCRIDKRKFLSEDSVQNLLSNNVWSCKWVDCLGRRVKIRKRAFGEVRSMLRNNLNDLEGLEDSSRSKFDISK